MLTDKLLDRTRLPSLYSDLAVQKTSNPEGYSANVTAWESALTRALLAGQLPPEQRLILEASDDLLNALASPLYGRPSGLGCVFDDCLRQGKMYNLNDFLTSEESIYSRSWIPSPWKILQWSLRHAGVVGGRSFNVDGRLRRGNLVSVVALEETWKKLQQFRERSPQSLPDRIISRELFLKELNGLVQGTLSEQDVSVLLRYLSRDKHALSYDATTIKFKAPTASAPEPISHEDTSIASLKTLISNFTTQTTNLTARISTLQTTAQTYVKQGNKAQALSALRSKKLAERNLQSYLDTLHQLQEVYTKIETAADQVEVVAAMKSSAGVLKTMNKKVGGVERVEDVIETLREEMGKVDEVSGVLVEPLDSKTVLDEEEVDEELEALEREEKRKVETEQAEITRRRLAELEQTVPAQAQSQRQDAIKVPAALEKKEEMGQNDPLDEVLSTSIDELRKLDIKNPNGEERLQVPEEAA